MTEFSVACDSRTGGFGGASNHMASNNSLGQSSSKNIENHHSHHHKDVIKDLVDEAISYADPYRIEAKKNFEKSILLTLSLGLIAAPEALSLGLTAFAIGPITEAQTLEVLANKAMIDAASKAGALLSAKSLNLFSIFNSVPRKNFFHSATHLTLKEIFDKTISMGLKTKENEALLWSGFGKEGVIISTDFANKCGFKTLEMTEGGKWLQNLDLFHHPKYSQVEVNDLFEKVSMEFVRQSQGKINIITGYVREDSIFYKEIASIEDKDRLNYLLMQLRAKP